jgi:cytochrome b
MATSAVTARRKIRIWDPGLRLFHWALALLVAFAWWTHHAGLMTWHKRIGYAVAALLAFRLFWGLFGAETARFTAFVRGPASVWRYVRGHGAPEEGHNPLGALSVVALLFVAALVTALGFFSLSQEDLGSGLFSARLSVHEGRLAARLHGWAFDGLLALVAAHLFAIVVYALRGNNLVGPMITGRKTVSAATPAPASAARWAWVLGGLVLAGVFLTLMGLDPD